MNNLCPSNHNPLCPIAESVTMLSLQPSGFMNMVYFNSRTSLNAVTSPSTHSIVSSNFGVKLEMLSTTPPIFVADPASWTMMTSITCSILFVQSLITSLMSCFHLSKTTNSFQSTSWPSSRSLNMLAWVEKAASHHHWAQWWSLCYFHCTDGTIWTTTAWICWWDLKRCLYSLPSLWLITKGTQCQ